MIILARLHLYTLHDQPGPTAVAALRSHGALADRILCVSQYQAAEYRALVPGLEFDILRNGIDLDLIARAVDGVERDQHQICYISRPERGLEVLLRDVLPAIIEREPRCSLHIATYANTAAGDYPRLRELAATFNERVVWHPPLAKRDLYRLLASCGLVLYATPSPNFPDFAETFCIAAVEAMACGAAWVSTDRGALPETVGDAGVLVPLNGAAHAGEPEVVRRLVEAAIGVMHDPERLRAAGRARASAFGWAPVAEKLLEMVPRPKVFIGTPAYDRRCDVGYVRALLQTLWALEGAGYGSRWEYAAGVALVPLARNHIAAAFLADPEATALLLVDADIVWQPDDVLRLLAHSHDCVVGLYPRRQAGPPSWAAEPRLDQGRPVWDENKACFQVKWAGVGFALITRSVFQRLIERFPDRRILRGGCFDTEMLESGAVFDFFPSALVDGGISGEDVGFCYLLQEAGVPIYADPTVTLGHVGTQIFSGEPMSMFAAHPTTSVRTELSAAEAPRQHRGRSRGGPRRRHRA